MPDLIKLSERNSVIKIKCNDEDISFDGVYYFKSIFCTNHTKYTVRPFGTKRNVTSPERQGFEKCNY